MRACSNAPDAVACLRGGKEAPGLRGRAEFYQRHGEVLVVVRVSGLPREKASAFFALHIHEGSSCTGEEFSHTGSHYNPAGVPHPDHAGDLPPLLSANGRAYLAVVTDRFGVDEIIGRTVVIHSGPDDFHSQPAGAAGTKLACGVIRPRSAKKSACQTAPSP